MHLRQQSAIMHRVARASSFQVIRLYIQHASDMHDALCLIETKTLPFDSICHLNPGSLHLHKQNNQLTIQQESRRTCGKTVRNRYYCKLYLTSVQNAIKYPRILPTLQQTHVIKESNNCGTFLYNCPFVLNSHPLAGSIVTELYTISVQTVHRLHLCLNFSDHTGLFCFIQFHYFIDLISPL